MADKERDITEVAQEIIDRVDLADYMRRTIKRVLDREKYGTFPRIVVPKKEKK